MTSSDVLKIEQAPVSKTLPVPSLVGGNANGPLQFHQLLKDECGDVAQFRLGPLPIYQITHPDHVERVFRGSNADFRKGRGWLSTRCIIGDGLITCEPDRWLARRRALQPAFARAYHERFAQNFSSTIEKALPRFERLARDEKPVALLNEMSRLAFCNANLTLLGQKTEHEIEKWMPHVFTSLDYANVFFYIPPYKRIIGRYLPHTSHGRCRHARRELHRLAARAVKERRQQRARGEELPTDMLTQLLFHPDRSASRRYSSNYVRDEVMTFLFAAHETTALALSWAWWFLSQHPDVEERLHEELHRVLDGRPPAFDDLEKMPYSRMIIEETLRLRPPVWNIMRESTQDERFGDYVVPGRSIIQLIPWLTHRHADFWDEPERFEPLRFSPEHQAGRHPYAYVPFGGGPRQCIGRRTALVEVQLALCGLAQHFTMRPAPDYDGEQVAQLTLRPRLGMPMTIHARSSVSTMLLTKRAAPPQSIGKSSTRSRFFVSNVNSFQCQNFLRQKNALPNASSAEPLFRLESLSPSRAAVVSGMKQMPRGPAFCVVASCDISRFVAFEEQCRQNGCRAPWFYAYVARCMGVTLQGQTHFIASRYNGQHIVPSFVQVKIAVEGTGATNDKVPFLIMFQHLGTRDLPDISQEMRVQFRKLRRAPVMTNSFKSRFAPPGSPAWWCSFVQAVRSRRAHDRYRDACNMACAHLSSTSHFIGDHGGWGLQMFTACALSVTLGGINKRAVVVNDEIVIRPYVDMAITFDHDITDGAPATRYVRQLGEEIESGRLLQEHPMTPAPRSQGTAKRRRFFRLRDFSIERFAERRREATLKTTGSNN